MLTKKRLYRRLRFPCTSLRGTNVRDLIGKLQVRVSCVCTTRGSISVHRGDSRDGVYRVRGNNSARATYLGTYSYRTNRSVYSPPPRVGGVQRPCMYYDETHVGYLGKCGRACGLRLRCDTGRKYY